VVLKKTAAFMDSKRILTQGWYVVSSEAVKRLAEHEVADEVESGPIIPFDHILLVLTRLARFGQTSDQKVNVDSH